MRRSQVVLADAVLPTQAMPEADCVDVSGTLHADIRDEKKLLLEHWTGFGQGGHGELYT